MIMGDASASPGFQGVDKRAGRTCRLRPRRVLGLHSQRESVCREYAKSRRHHRKPWLRWRGRNSFDAGHAACDGPCFVFHGAHYETLHLRDMPARSTIELSSFKADRSARWYFRRMPSYKAMTHLGSTLEVCEWHTSQSCSERGLRPASPPRGIAGLRKNMFACDDCVVVLDRDVNARRNILRTGQDVLAGGAHV